MPSSDRLLLGHVVKPHGIRGEVKVALLIETWEPFRGVPRCWLALPGGEPAAVEIEQSRGCGRTLILGLRGVRTPEGAAALVGATVWLPREALPPAAEGSFYQEDLLGLAVVVGERELGRVREILATPAHDLFVVDGPEGEWMLPATRAHIQEIDLDRGRIAVAAGVDVAGLLHPERAEGGQP
jgi:16S rRNA processing protein RimM